MLCGPGDALPTRLGGNERFHRIALPQRRRGDDRRPRTFEMRYSAISRLPTCDAAPRQSSQSPKPVVCRSRERGMRIDQFAEAFDVAVRRHHGLPDHRRRLVWERVGHGRAGPFS